MTGSLAAKVDVGTALADTLRSVLLFVPKFIAFVVILIIGWLVARVLRSIVDKTLERVGFDRWVERGGIKSALERSRYDASDIVAQLVYYTVLLFPLQLAFGVFGPNPVSSLIGAIVAWLPRAFVAIVILVVVAAIAGAVRDLVANALGGLSYGRLLATVVSWFIIGLGVIAALNQIGVATTVTTPILIAALATIAGILIVGVGGGLIRPMQNPPERLLDRAARESATIAEHARAYAAGQRDTAEQMGPAYPYAAAGAPAGSAAGSAAGEAAGAAESGYPPSAEEPETTVVLPPGVPPPPRRSYR